MGPEPSRERDCTRCGQDFEILDGEITTICPSCEKLEREKFPIIRDIEIVKKKQKQLIDIPKIEFKTYFTDVQIVGEGGCIVYCGLWQNYRVAIKAIKIRETAGPATLENIKNELKITSMMRHDRTLTLFGACRDDSTIYLITRYYPKGTLHQLLHGQEPVKQNKISFCILVKDICEGLNYLHNQRPPILHLDLKPKNILLDGYQEKRAVLADFGISTLKLESQPQINNAGTMWYMAPELVTTNKNDIYALGIIMWEMVHNLFPYHHLPAGKFDIRNEVIHGERPQWVAEIPVEIKTLITDCWDIEPQKRPSADKVLEIIENLLQNKVINF